MSKRLVDRWVLADVGKASKRALEVRDELIGTVVGSNVAKFAAKSVNEGLVAPVRELKTNISATVMDGIKLILGKVGVGGN
jgi:hypothetical protein